ncbi:MAG: cupin domain-containing protein [Verrucomicrobiales bacterium]|nr:cupin domain-containing protein [Verrucomicrobiales bacterium]
MKHVATSSIPWVERRSPKGKFHVFRRHISQALGAPADAGVGGGGHPFEVELTRIPPGTTNFPLHRHAAQWEFYVVLSGSGELRTTEGTIPIVAGDAFVCPPGDAHQIRNSGAEDLVYYVIADNPPADVVDYPDSGKWFIKPQRKCFVLRETDYFAGEE